MGSIVVTLNARLLKAKVSLTQSLTILGYSSFPLMLSAFFIFIMQKIGRIAILELLLAVFCGFLCVRSAFSILSTTIEPSKHAMVGFPTVIYYIFLTYLMILLI